MRLTTKMSMNIYLVINRMHGGGAESLFLSYCNELVRRHESEITVVSLFDNDEDATINISDNINYLYLDLKRKPLKGIYRFFENVRIDKPNIIHSWLYLSNLISSLICFFVSGSARLVWHIHHSDISFKNNSFSSFASIYLSALFSWFIRPKIVFVSQKAFDRHKRAMWHIHDGVVIYNAIDLSRLRKTRKSYSNVHDIGLRSLRIGVIGRYDKIKNIPIILESLSVYVNLYDALDINSVYLIGEGMNRDNLELVKIIERYNLVHKIELMGYQNDIQNCYRNLDLVVSMSKDESFGLVQAECLVCGVLCLSTAEADPLNFCSGVLRLESASSEAFIKSMKSLSELSSVDLDRIIKYKRRKIIDDFSLENFTNKLLEIYYE